ncbi:hypothetical protein ACLQ2S_08140 [Micromonospora sp. DT48]|uniref:hypothetical protein n=1 Tax=unclassified Micromonospora TaxID=2617518 RepID=UPI0012BCCC1B|nr:hypothetical protein [Micromonospora sp. CP22]MTK02432.1 hypothetical protein [Micromonospora sp. CP22]
MSDWADWLERASWIAAIIGLLVTVIVAVQASNISARTKATLEVARPFVRALALSLDKPEIMAAYESECTTAKDVLRKKTRRRLGTAGVILGFAASSVTAALLLSQIPPAHSRTEIRFSIGNAAQQECTTTGLNLATRTTCTNRWFLDSPGQTIQAQATLSGPARQRDLSIAVSGCSDRAQVRWELLADGEALGNGTAGSGHQKQELRVPQGKSSLTIQAERIDDNSCSAELVVDAVQWP